MHRCRILHEVGQELNQLIVGKKSEIPYLIPFLNNKYFQLDSDQ